MTTAVATKRVMVTGSSGFVGHHVRKRFTDSADWDVSLHDIGMTLNPRVPVDVVVSLAASADPRQALADPAGAYENSVRATVETMEYARQVGARVLHVSTNEVYGTKARLPYAPVGPYAGGKACQEMVCHAYPDVPTTIVVTQSLFGERQQRDKLIPTIIRKLLAGESIPLQRSGDTWAARPFMHVRNLADAFVHLAEHQVGERVHVGMDNSASVIDVASIIADALGVARVDIQPIEVGDRPGHELVVQPIRCDIPAWRPTYFAEAALRDVARWYRENPHWL
jgi:dTDP-glucose 4,6-dehydratase